jgi:hypothetical protein
LARDRHLARRPRRHRAETSEFFDPSGYADAEARRDGPTTKTAKQRYWRIDEIARKFPQFEDNFTLNPEGNSRLDDHRAIAQMPT